MVFQEVQKLPRWIMLISGLGMLIVMIAVILSDQSVDIWAYGTMLFSLLVVGSLMFIKLQTKINADHVEINFFPFTWSPKIITWSEIEKIEVIKYRPIKEYGGWGLKANKHGRAYSTSGSYGIKIHIKNAKHILIGTLKPEEAKAYLNSIGKL